MLTVILFAALAIWLLVWWTAFVGPLRQHRTGDRELVAELDRLRADLRHATPRLGFYIGVVAALALAIRQPNEGAPAAKKKKNDLPSFLGLATFVDQGSPSRPWMVTSRRP